MRFSKLFQSVRLAATLFVFLLPLHAANGESATAPNPAPGAVDSSSQVSPELAQALEKLNLPGVKIDLAERCVDVDSEVCLRDGMLELIACTKDSKEHESIVMVLAKPSHIHTALLLLGAKAGNPAMRKAIDQEGTRFIDLPPRGGPIDVFLVVSDSNGKETERPISDFIMPSERFGEEEGEEAKFPTHTFLFAGSFLHGQGEGPRTYVCDQTGNVISIATFGDELLCLPDIHSNENGALAWQVDGENLPAVGSRVTLRLRPKFQPPVVPKKESPAEK